MSWKKLKLGDLLDYYSVRAKDIGSFTDLEFCGVSNEDGITISKYAAEDKAEEYKVIEKGCFAYNPYRINVGSIALMKEEKKGLISPAYVVFKPKPDSIIPELLLKFLKSAEGLRQIKQNARGTVRQALRFEDLCKIEITIPKYDEQLELYKSLEIKQNKFYKIKFEQSYQLDLLKKIRQQILQDAVQGKLVPQDPVDEPASKLQEEIKAEKDKLVREKKIRKEKPLPTINQEEIPFEIPKNWVWCRLSEVGIITGGGTPSMANPEFWNGEIPWISPKDMSGEYIMDTEMKVTPKGIENSSAKRIPRGSLIIVGRSGILKRKLPVAINVMPCTVNQDMKVIIPYLSRMNRYLQLMLFGMERIVLKDFVKFGMTVHSLKYNEFAIMPIPLPPISEQYRIVTKIEQLMTLCNEFEQSVQQNQKYTQELLQVALKEALEPKN